MPTPQHHETQHKLAPRPPPARKAHRIVRQPYRYPHTPVRRDDLKDDVEDRIMHRVREEMRRLDGHDDEHRQREPPQIMRQLAADLLAHEARTGLAAVVRRCGAYAREAEVPPQEIGDDAAAAAAAASRWYGGGWEIPRRRRRCRGNAPRTR